jgi:beta-xylosidase/lysophospholipase L1-like esterase
MSRLRLLLVLLLPAWALAGEPKAADNIHFVLVGDSTVNDEGGWGDGFKRFVADGVIVSNTAQNGRSSKSFRDEGHWAKALALKGDYYLIQFGHNDEPGKGPERETDPATTYTANLARYVDEVRAIGGRPVLVTSLTRRNFDSTRPDRLKPNLVPYVEAMKRLAAEKHVPLLDLHALSVAYCEKIGPAETAVFNAVAKGKPDTTHLSAAGRLAFGRIVAQELRRVVPALAPVLLTEPRPREYTNPIISGDWSDPGVIRVGDDYYTCRSSFGWQPGIPIAHSRDLVHWEYIGHAFATHPKLQSGDTRFGIWGVEMGYNPNTKQFLIYAPTRDGELFVFSSDHPGGPYVMKSLGVLGIDPGFFADDDGRLYLITNKAVIHELTPDGLGLKGDITTVDRSRYKFFEGPDIFRHGGWYYLLFSDGGTLPHEPSTISTLRARSLAGPWEADPGNPVLFSTDNGARFEAPAHGTLIDTPKGEWFITYHAHETAYYSLGREMLLQPIVWTPDGWWRPVGGKVPPVSAAAPDLPAGSEQFAQSDEFDSPGLGLQWFFTCAPDFSGATWSLTESPGSLRIHPPPGDLGSLPALPAIFQQRVIDRQFSFETKLTFDARADGEAAGLHLYHDPLMNLWLASTMRDGKKVIAVGKYNLGRRTDLWSVPNPHGSTVHLRIVVDGREGATFFFGPDGRHWQQVGEGIYFGASGHHLRDGRRGDPDLGWVGRYKDPTATTDEINGGPNPALPNRGGNVWTAATFGVFAVRGGNAAAPDADFDYLHVTHP